MNRQEIINRLADLYRSHTELVTAATDAKKRRFDLLKSEALGEKPDAKELDRLRTVASGSEERAEASLGAAEVLIGQIETAIGGELDGLAAELAEVRAALGPARAKAMEEVKALFVPLLRNLGFALETRRKEHGTVSHLHLVFPEWFGEKELYAFKAQVESAAKELPSAPGSPSFLADLEDELSARVKGRHTKTPLSSLNRFDVKEETLRAVEEAVALADLSSCPHSLAFLDGEPAMRSREFSISAPGITVDGKRFVSETPIPR